jgi:predicted acetyltransferase
MGGVRAVAARVEHRRRGYATRVVRASLDAMRARGEALSVLYPQVVRPYRRLGWEIAGTLLFRQVPPSVLARIAAPAVPIRRAGDVDRAAIRACYDRVARATNGFLDRPDGRWAWLFERFDEAFLFLAGNEGYVLYEHLDPPGNGPEGFRLLVRELVATTPGALRALWAMLGTTTSVVPNLFFRSGPVEPLAALLDGNEATVARERPWMLRLVDAPAAVAARGYPAHASGDVALDVADDWCPWNAGRWRLVVERGAGRLERGGAGVVRLGIGAFAALYSGWSTTDSLARTGLLDGGSEADRATLDDAFGGPTPWMLDEF